MSKCPNKSIPAWKELEAEYGEFEAYRLYMINNDEIPSLQEARDLLPNKPIKELDNKLKDVLSKLGIDVKSLDIITDEQGNSIDAVAKADLLQKVIEVVENKQDATTLPEEAATMIMSLMDKNSPLFKQMINKSGNTKMYQTVKAQYSEVYNNNEEKLRFETATKLIAQEIIKLYEETQETESIKTFTKDWFKKVLRKLKNIFKTFTSNDIFNLTDPYRTVAKNILNDELRGLKKTEEAIKDFIEYTPVFYELSDTVKAKREALLSRLKADKAGIGTIRKRKDRHGYERLNEKGEWVPVKYSVSDLVKLWDKGYYGKRLDDSTMSKVLANSGTYGHAMFDNIINQLHTYMQDRPYTNYDNTVDEFMRQFDWKSTAELAKKEVMQLQDMPKEPEFYNFMNKANSEAILIRSAILYKQLIANQVKINKQTGIDAKFDLISELPIYDEAKDMAGTIDLMAIYSNGKIALYDYKFKKNFMGEANVPQSKEFKIQIGGYKNILAKKYDIEDFAETRIIPMSLKLDLNDNVKKIEYGFNTKKDPNSYFGDITTANETIGKELDKSLEKLYKEKDTLEERVIKFKGSRNRTEAIRAEQKLYKINNIINAIVVKKDVNNVTNLLNTITEDLRNRFLEPDQIDSTTLNPYKLNDQLIVEANEVLEVFDDFVEHFINSIDKGLKSDKDVGESIKNISLAIAELKAELHEKSKESIERFARGSLDLPVKEKSPLEIQFTALDDWDRGVMSKLSEVTSLVDFNLQEDMIKFEKNIKEKLNNISKAGISSSKAFNSIFNEETGNLIHKFKKELINDAELGNERVESSKLKKAVFSNDKKWLNKNTNLVSTTLGVTYGEKELKILDERLAQLKRDNELKYANYTPKQRDKLVADISDRTRTKWFSKEFMSSPKNDLVQFKETDDTLSKEYNSLHTTVKEFYNFLQKFNQEAYDITGGKITRNFIPELQDSMVSTIMKNGFKGIEGFQNIAKQAALSLKIREEDELAGNKDNTIPLLLTDTIMDIVLDNEVDKIRKEVKLSKEYKDKSKEEIDAEVDSRVYKLSRERGKKLKSKDLGKSYMLFAQTLYSYKHLKEYEFYVNNLLFYAKDKYANKTIRTDNKGESLKEKIGNWASTVSGLPTSEEEAVKKYIDYLWYGKKIQSKDSNILGLSKNKLVRKAMQWKSTNALGLNIFPAVGSFIGASANMVIEASSGKYTLRGLKKTMIDIGKNWHNTSIMADYFGIGEGNYEKADYLSNELVEKALSTNSLFFMMKYPDFAIKKTIMVSMLKSYGVKNGKIEKLDRMEKGSKSLYELYSYNKDTGKVDMSLSKEEITRFKRMLGKEIDSVIGTMSDTNIRLYKTNLLLVVLMQFKNWMPGLVKSRFGKLKYDYDFEDFSEGRFRVLANTMFNEQNGFLKGTLKSLGFISAHIPILKYITNLNPTIRGLKKINEDISEIQFNKFYEENKNMFKNLTRDEAFSKFKEMKQNQLNAFGREINIMLFFLISLLLIGGAGDEEDAKARRASWYYKMLNRGTLELTFFFNPMDTYQILKRPLPLLSLVNDITHPNLYKAMPLGTLKGLYSEEIDDWLNKEK